MNEHEKNSGLDPMRIRPEFLGTVIGLAMTLLLPAQMAKEEKVVFFYMSLFGLIGFSTGVCFRILRRRQRSEQKQKSKEG
jgi:hypothetical protein